MPVILPNQQSTAPSHDASLAEWLTYMHSIHVSAIDMGLSRVLPVAEKLGIIQSAKDDAYVFMVAGTNGKGSTTAIIAEICQQAGLKTALYQSPHLLHFNERIRINTQPVADAVLIAAFVQVEQARVACELTLSFFEMTTLAALLIFAQADCDVWVLEVGLGGRLDVVNIIDADVAVITNVGIDHVDWLGDDREKIAFEKAGILRSGIPLIYGEADMPEAIRQQIESKQVICHQHGTDFSYSVPDAEPSAPWVYGNAAVTMQLPKPTLSLTNAANAISAVLVSRLAISQSMLAQALQQVQLAGRFEYAQQSDRHWLFDVAHNPQGIAFFLAQLQPFWAAHLGRHPQAKLQLVFSMLADKDIAHVIEQLVQADLPIERWYIAPIDHPRAASLPLLVERLYAQIPAQEIKQADALDLLTQTVVCDTQEVDLIVVCGSFHTIAEVQSQLSASLCNASR